MASAEKTVEIRIPKASAELDAFMAKRGLSDRAVGTALGVSGAAVYNWRVKGQPPGDTMQERLETFCAEIDERTKEPKKDRLTGRVKSHVPRESWRLAGHQGPALPPVEPFDAHSAAGASGAR
jgi:predicted transcriptional regulator